MNYLILDETDGQNTVKKNQIRVSDIGTFMNEHQRRICMYECLRETTEKESSVD